ncbi:lytic transglycosylase, partial [Candidatus Magnetoovum chiemensis]
MPKSLRDTVIYTFALLIILCCAFNVHAKEYEQKAKEENIFALQDPYIMPYPKSLKPQVDFWINVFTKYNSSEIIIHDNKYLNIVYAVINVPDIAAITDDEIKSRKDKEIENIKTMLLSLNNKTVNGKTELTKEETTVSLMFDKIAGKDKYLEAIKRLRTQIGVKDRFKEALSRSTLYIKDMERVFQQQGIPLELTRLAFLESLFDVNAQSPAGAVGLWQFMKSTGRKYLTINEAIDERKDPIKSSKAAAKLLL